MKLAIFHYVDAKGKESDRSVLVLSEPSNKLTGIDVSELPDQQIQDFATDYELLYSDFLQKVTELKVKYDLTHNFRQFIDKQISELEIENA